MATATLTLTVGDILYRAYRAAGILHAPMRGLSGSEQAEGVLELNSFLDALKSERAWVYAIERRLVPINANQSKYVIGENTDGGIPDWVMERPETIQRAGFIYTNVTPNIEVAFEIYSEQQWAALSPKDLQSTIPYVLYYQPFTPNGLVHLFPVPTSSWQAALYLWRTVSQIAGPDDVLEIPPAYNDTLVYGLAVRLAILYPKLVNPVILGEVKLQAAAAKQRVRTMNFPALIAECESGSMGARVAANYGAKYNPLSNSYNQ